MANIVLRSLQDSTRWFIYGCGIIFKKNNWMSEI